jgi:hypothetical protein
MANPTRRIGVVLFQFGGPDTPELPLLDSRRPIGLIRLVTKT